MEDLFQEQREIPAVKLLVLVVENLRFTPLSNNLNVSKHCKGHLVSSSGHQGQQRILAADMHYYATIFNRQSLHS